MKLSKKLLAIGSVLALALFSISCGSANSQSVTGGDAVFAGHYVYSSWGQLANGTLYFEDGTIDADGAGHTTQCGAGAYNGLTNRPTAPACDHWTYSLISYQGTADSSVGDHAFLFCSATGKICQYVSNPNVGWSWTARIERE
jgi:hypothetical protein